MAESVDIRDQNQYRLLHLIEKENIIILRIESMIEIMIAKKTRREGQYQDLIHGKEADSNNNNNSNSKKM